jgi:WD40 repeat protein
MKPLPDLPMTLWKHDILPCLDRASWNSLLAASSFLWRQKESLPLPLWPRSGKLRVKSTISKLQISKEWLAVGCRDGSVTAWHVRDGGGEEFEMMKRHEEEILGMHIVNDDWLISVCQKVMAVWNLRDILATRKSPSTRGIISSTPYWEHENLGYNFRAMVGFPKYPEHILCGHFYRQPHAPNQMLTVWKLVGGTMEQETHMDEDAVERISVSENHIAVVCFSVEIRLYECSHPENLSESTITAAWDAHEHRIKALAFSTGGEFLVSSSLGFLHSSDEATIRVWDLQGEVLYKWSPSDVANINVYSICFLPCHPSWLATGGMTGTINIWDLVTPTRNDSGEDADDENRPQSALPGKYSHGVVWAVYALAACGTTLVSGGGDETVRLSCIEG